MIDLEALEALIDKAYTHVCDIASGRDRWTMRIPAQEHSDSDLVLSTALAGAQKLLEEVRQLRGQVAAVGEANIHLNARLGEVKRERDLAVAHDRQPYPTAHAYEAACAALEKHRQRADLLEAQRDQVLAHLDEITKMSTIPGGDLHAAANWKASDTFDTIRAIFSVSRTPHEAQHG